MIRNKKAFSLLEVLLAMAIMLIASVMIMQGFMSTYSYSGNTKVYAIIEHKLTILIVVL